MRGRLLIALAALTLGGCFGRDDPPVAAFPVLPDLPAEVVADCPAAELLTGTLGDLATKDAKLSVEYAKCKARKDTAVGAYQDAQRRLKSAATTNKAASATQPR